MININTKDTLLLFLRKGLWIFIQLITIVGFVMALPSYLDNRKKYELSYYRTTTPIQIYKHTDIKSLLLYEYDSIENRKIEDDVYVISGCVWNSGDYEIEKKDVREPLHIKLDNIERIISASIVKHNAKNESNFTLKMLDKQTLDIDWKYFDPSKGFQYQVIYVGSDSVFVDLIGEIAKFSTFKERPNLMINDLDENFGVIFFCISMTILFLFGVPYFLFLNLSKMKTDLIRLKVHKIFFYIAIILSISYTIFVCIMLYKMVSIVIQAYSYGLPIGIL